MKIFARKNESGNYEILHAETGEPVTRLEANVYPVDSGVGARYEHPNGIVLEEADVRRLDVPIEADGAR